MRELAYSVHPYRWMTIGKELSHVENAKLEDVKKFFFKFYRPVNAILVVAGNVTTEQVKQLAEKWFADIPPGEKYNRNLPQEPLQTKAKKMEITADVPLDALYKSWHISSRLNNRYYIADLITDILSGGGSTRLYHALVKEKKLFSSIECYHFGSLDNGLLAVEGKLVKGIKIEEGEKAVNEELEKLKNEMVNEAELQKVKNKTESTIAFEDIPVMNRANSLAFYELLGNAELMNQELEKYNSITTEDILQESGNIFKEENSNTIYYYSKN
jgi:predicted Zn-dependent peptidase